MPKVLGMNCPHCGTRAQIQASEQITPTLRRVYFQCINILCSHSWVANLEAIHTISPAGPLYENPMVQLPLSPRAEQERIWGLINGDAKQSSIFDLEDEENNNEPNAI